MNLINAATRQDEHSFVVFQMDGRRFALPAGDINELAPPVRLHTFPHTTPLLEGVIVRRGHIVPVYDAAVLAGCNSVAHRFYLVARRGAGQPAEFAAIPVAGECELVSGDLLPAISRPAYVSGTLVIGSESIEVLDMEKLVASSSSPAVLPANAHPQAGVQDGVQA
jgi:chemotaxis signal transduction protein